MKKANSVVKELRNLVFIYFFIYILGYIFNFLIEPFIFWIDSQTFSFLINRNNEFTGSGDNLYQYIKVLVLFVFSFIIWVFHRFIIDLKEKQYYWIILSVRIYLLTFMMIYGFAKLAGGQFPYPSLLRLTQSFGDATPMNLAWTFMGYSKGYTFFTGLAEVVGGILLINRKTVLLGSLILVGVMGNVFVMNLAYDIPVKLFSFHLLSLSILLVLIDIKRLYGFFIANKSVEYKKIYYPVKNIKDFKKAGFILKCLFIGYLIFICIVKTSIFSSKESKELPIYGIYEIKSFIKNEDIIPLTINNKNIWRYIVFENSGFVSVRFMDNNFKTFKIRFEDDANTFYLVEKETDFLNRFHYKLQERKKILIINGSYRNDSLKIIFEQKNLKDFNLVNNKFRWINEAPRNF